MRETSGSDCPMTTDVRSEVRPSARPHDVMQSRVDAGRNGGADRGGATGAVTRRAFIGSLAGAAAFAGETLYDRCPFGVPRAHAAIRRPEDFTHFYAQLPGIKIHYVREGSGPALVLMHGWPGFWWEWYKCIGELAKHFDVIAPDMRGYGDSEKPDLNDLSKYHLNVVTDDHANLLRHLGIDQAYVVGHDWSSVVMHKFVRKHRQMTVKGLIIDPFAPGAESQYLSIAHFPESWYSQFHQLPMAVELVSSSRQATKIYFKHFLNHWSYNKNLLTDEELEIYTDNFVKPGNILGGFNYYRANLCTTCAAWTPLDLTISDVPMTFLSGMGDTVVRSTWTDRVAAWYNNYTIEYVADGGHFLMVEKPDLVTDRIRKAFLR